MLRDDKENPKRQKVEHTPTAPAANSNGGTQPFLPKPRALKVQPTKKAIPLVKKNAPVGFPFFPPTSVLPNVNNTVSNENNTPPISTMMFKSMKEEEQQVENKEESQVTTTKVPQVTPTNVPPVKQHEHLQLIGRLAHFTGQIPCDNDLNLLARYYGLVLIGVIAEQVPTFVGEKNSTLVGERHKFANLPQTLYHGVQIRNSIADFFIRIKDHTFVTMCDEELNDFAQLDTIDGEARLGKLTKWRMQAELIDTYRNTTVRRIDRLAYIINALKLIVAYSSMDPGLNSDVTTFGIAMLYVIAGTCARELLDSLGSHKDDDRDLQNIAKILHEMRDKTFAHFYIAGKNTEKFKRSIKMTNQGLNALISKLEAEIPYAESEFLQLYDKNVTINISGQIYPTGSISANLFNPDLSLSEIYRPLEVNNTTAIQVVN